MASGGEVVVVVLSKSHVSAGGGSLEVDLRSVEVVRRDHRGGVCK